MEPGDQTKSQSAAVDFIASQDITEIVPGLFLGNMNAAKAETELKSRKITTIINCAQTAELADSFDSNTFQYIRLNMVEHPHPLSFNATKIFERGVDEITRALQKGESVLVHCIGGMCRSPSIVVAYLIKEKKMTTPQAYRFVRELRPIVDINKIYMIQLENWKNQQSSSSTTS